MKYFEVLTMVEYFMNSGDTNSCYLVQFLLHLVYTLDLKFMSSIPEFLYEDIIWDVK